MKINMCSKSLNDIFGLNASDYDNLTITDIMAYQKQSYLRIMLSRLAIVSKNENFDKNPPHLNKSLFHGSLYGWLETLDPTRGQGLGVWFQSSLKDAASFALSRSKTIAHVDEDKFLTQTVYEAELSFQKIAIFPDEVSLYRFYIEHEDDPEELQFGPELEFREIREALLKEGYEGIWLFQENTVSALVAPAIKLVSEYDASTLQIQNKNCISRLKLP